MLWTSLPPALVALLVWRWMRLLRALDAERKQASDAASARSQFFASVTHEIRSPMTAVLGYVELLRDCPDMNPAERNAWLATIASTGEKLLCIVNDLLELSRLETGKLTVAPGPCRPGEIVDDVVRLYAQKARNKSLELSAEITTGHPGALITDAKRLRQVLVNLVSNAIKYTESGQVCAQVRTTAPSADGRVRLSISVADTGVGITAEDLAGLFDPFSQAPRPAGTAGSGTGLGLFISRHLAQLLGGKLTACSTPGRGSTFTLELDLPLASGREAGLRELTGANSTMISPVPPSRKAA